MIKLMALVMKQLKTKQIMIRTFNEKDKRIIRYCSTEVLQRLLR